MLPTLWDILESINPHKNHLKNCCSLDCVKKATLVRRTKHLWSKFSYQTNYSSSHQMSTLITISKDLAPTRPVQGIAPWRSCAALLIDMKGSSIKKMVTTVRMIRVKTIGNVGRYTLYNHISFILWTSTRTSTYCWKREPKDPVAPPRLLHFYLASPLFYALPLMLKLNWEGLLACQQFWNSQNFPIVTQASLVCFASIFVNLSVFTFLPLSVFASTVLRLATQFLQSTSLACLTLFLG